MQKEKALNAPCGLYCGVCSILIAYRDNNERLKEKLSMVYNCSTGDIVCEGCLSNNRFMYCEVCQIRSCAQGKNYEGCHQCDEFPCGLINDFPVPVGKKVILRSVPARRRLGTEKWVDEEVERYHCPHCGGNLFRGAKRCSHCKEAVDQD
jgi:hypothetical protein